MNDNEISPALSQKKPYEAPVVRRTARLPVVTAGSFDLILPS